MTGTHVAVHHCTLMASSGFTVASDGSSNQRYCVVISYHKLVPISVNSKVSCQRCGYVDCSRSHSKNLSCASEMVFALTCKTPLKTLHWLLKLTVKFLMLPYPTHHPMYQSEHPCCSLSPSAQRSWCVMYQACHQPTAKDSS